MPPLPGYQCIHRAKCPHFIHNPLIYNALLMILRRAAVGGDRPDESNWHDNLAHPDKAARRLFLERAPVVLDTSHDPLGKHFLVGRMGYQPAFHRIADESTFK